MKRTDLIPVMLLLPVFGFVAVQAMHTRAITATSAEASLAPASRFHAHWCRSISWPFACRPRPTTRPLTPALRFGNA